MKPLRVVLLVLTFSFGSEILQAQTSIGFRNPGNTASLKEYRLPAWSYQQIYVDLYGTLYGETYKSEHITSYRNDQYTYRFSASLVRYDESEDRIRSWSLNPQFSGYYTIEDVDRRAPNSDDRYIHSRSDVPMDLTGSLKWYIQPNVFIHASPGLSISSSRYLTRWEVDDDLERRRTVDAANYSTTHFGGLGFGRVRNVTPVIRALRFYERLAELNPNRTENHTDVTRTAAVFSKLQGFTIAFDRPGKSFWSDVFESAGLSTESLRPFDVLYLSETNSESMIQRFEGWDIQLGPTYSATRRLERQKDTQSWNPDYRNLLVEYRYGAKAGFRYYMNPSLNRMVGFFLTTAVEKPDLNAWSTPQGTFVNTDADIQWMQTVADRFMIDQILSLNYRQFQADGPEPDSKVLQLEYSINWVVFVENATSIQLNVRMNRVLDVFDQPNTMFTYDYTGNTMASIGIRHYFGRSANL